MKTRLNIPAIMALLLGIAFSGCALEKDVDVVLPEYESELVVECYMVPGDPYKLLLQESVSYFEAPTLPLVDGALVVISHNGIHDTLRNELLLDAQYGKVHNYLSDSLVPHDYGGEWTLSVVDGLGRKLTGKTTLLDSVPLKPIEFTHLDSSRNSVTVRWNDDPSASNYYQFTLQFGALSEKPYLSFTLDDRVGNGDEFVLSTLPNIPSGRNAWFTVQHFEEGAWRFLTSTDDAESTNGNPFAQPGSIYSNVEGGIGVFAAVATTRRNLTIP